MHKALEQARLGASVDEVPVGAVIVRDNQLIAHAFNEPRRTHDPSAHAELLCLRKAGEHMGNYRLCNTTLYVTLEPCMMCASAMVHARIQRLVFGAFDNKTGVIETVDDFFNKPYLNHRIEACGGIEKDQCAQVLQNFFKTKR